MCIRDSGAPSWAPGPSCSERRLVQVGRVGMCHTLIHTLIHTHVLYLCLFFHASTSDGSDMDWFAPGLVLLASGWRLKHVIEMILRD